jgi:putative transposase
MVSPARAREEVARVVRVHAVSERWAIKTLGVKRSTIRYETPFHHADYEARLTAAVIATCGRTNMRHYGYRRIRTELVKAGWSVSIKHVQRIMKTEGLLRPPKQRPRPAPGLSGNSITKLPPRHVNDVWTYDFISIRLADGSKLRMLSVLDEFSRFALPPLIARSIPAPAVVDHLAKLFRLYGIPKRIRSDNGPEFVAETVTSWLTNLGVQTRFIKPASPWENAYVETWHDKLRTEKLNDEVLITPAETRLVISDWIDHYNHDRPHSRLENQTPAAVRYPALNTPTLTQVDQT